MIGMGTGRTGKGKGREGRNSVSNDPPPGLGECVSVALLVVLVVMDGMHGLCS